MIETTPATSTLDARLRERIKREGAISFRDWMAAALYDSQAGYYCRTDRTRWGREGDYRTSPERSTLFAATFAHYFARLYGNLERPTQWTIVEAGAGDGRFASGVLQTFQRSFPVVFAATSYVIDEASSHSQSLARVRLEPFGDRVQFKKLSEVELDPGVVFSNELLDAFPVHRMSLRQDGELQEFYVTVDGDGKFAWQLGPPNVESAASLIEYVTEYGSKPRGTQIFEVNLEIEKWLRTVAEKMRKGFVVTVDYGLDGEDLYSRLVSQNGTLRGFRRHEFADDLLARPGEQDLTATVNWSYVKSVGALLRLEVVEFDRQDRFLLAVGLLEQLEIESRECADEGERLRLSTQAREMILPDGMASHFQVLVQQKSEKTL